MVWRRRTGNKPLSETMSTWFTGVYLYPQVLICLQLGEKKHHCDVIMGPIASQITSLKIVYSTVYSDADQRKHQSSASRAFVRGIHRGPVNSPHKWPVTRKMFPFDDVIKIMIVIIHYIWVEYNFNTSSFNSKNIPH